MSLALSAPPAMAESISPEAMRLASCARGKTRAARALQVVGRRRRVEPAAERAFAREVPVARVLDHRAGGYFADLWPFS